MKYVEISLALEREGYVMSEKVPGGRIT